MTIIRDIIGMYFRRSIPRASAALAYFLTMTFFPLIICLYALFGDNFSTALRVLNYLQRFLSPSAAEMIRNYVYHVAQSRSSSLLIAAVTILVTSASGAIRVIQSTIGDLQGGHRFRAWGDFLISFLLALALLFAVYFSIVVMLTGYDFLILVRKYFSIGFAASAWLRIRYLLLGSLALVILWGIFAVTKRRADHYHVFPGAALSTIAIVIMSNLFSIFIAASARYSLVYGALASLILLMFWLYLVCHRSSSSGLPSTWRCGTTARTSTWTPPDAKFAQKPPPTVVFWSQARFCAVFSFPRRSAIMEPVPGKGALG